VADSPPAESYSERETLRLDVVQVYTRI
jgi:hypothetical protein